MIKKVFHAVLFVLLFIVITMLCGCGRNSTEAEPPEQLSDEQALSAIRNYCYTKNPDLEDIVKAEQYPVYWDISSSDEKETVVLFRSYTGAQNRYYIDRITGETYVTEFVPGITPEEQRSGESFNVKNYFPED